MLVFGYVVVGLKLLYVGVVMIGVVICGDAVVESHRLTLLLKEQIMSGAGPNFFLHSYSTTSLPSPQHFEQGRQPTFLS